MAPKPWQPASTGVVTHALEVAGSIKGAAAHLGISSDTLRVWARREAFDLTPYGAATGAHVRLWKPESRAAFDAAMATATSVADLARTLGICKDTLRRWALQNDVDLAAVRAAGGRPAAPILEPAEQLERDAALERMRQERDNFRRLYDELVKERCTGDDLFRAIRDECATPRPAVKLKPRSRRTIVMPRREPVAQLSDWQLGEKVTPDESGGNQYDAEVFRTRLDRWQDAVIGSIRNQSRAYAIERASIAFCGDIVEGHDVYSGQPWALDMDAGRQVVEGGDWFAAAIESVVTSLPDTEWSVYCVAGNHGKPGGRKAGHTPPTLSFDWMLYKWLERECQNLPLREFVVEPGGRLLFWQAGHVFLLTHGDEVRGWGGFPHYGLDKAHGRLVVDLETIFKYWLLGHWHQSAALPAGRGARIVNGNAVGPNQLSQAAVLGSATPEQNLLFISEDFGLAEHAHIFLAPNEFVKPHIYGRPA